MKSRSNRSPEIDTTTLLFHLFSPPPLLSLSTSSHLSHSLSNHSLSPYTSSVYLSLHPYTTLYQITVKPLPLHTVSIYIIIPIQIITFSLLIIYLSCLFLTPSSTFFQWPQQPKPSKSQTRWLQKKSLSKTFPINSKSMKEIKRIFTIHKLKQNTEKTMNWQPNRERYKLQQKKEIKVKMNDKSL